MRLYINQTSVIALIAVGALFLCGCPAADDAGTDTKAQVPAADPAVSNETHSTPPADNAGNPCGEQAAPPADATEIFAAANCTMCHGRELEGSGLGPALSNIAAEWDEAELKTYVRDASKYKDTGNRLSHDPKWVMKMPPFPQGEQDLDTLVNWLLTK